MTLVPVQAQYYTRRLELTGRVLAAAQADSADVPLADATVQLLNLPDSTFAAGGVSDKEGGFRLFCMRKREGVNRFLLKVSFLGMETYQKELRTTIKDSKWEQGTIVLHPKSMTMQEMQIVGELKKMCMKGDTLVYNTDAYKMPDGSVLLELVRRLPGLYFSENGTLMYLDRPISEIRLNGESFFAHDLNIALKNVPVKELEQLKVYETVTEEDRLRGKTEKKQVMDMKTKRNVDATLLATLSAGAANRDKRYLLDGGVNYFKKKGAQIALNGNALNLPGNYDPDRPDMPPMLNSNENGEWNRKKVRLNWKQYFRRVSVNEDFSHTYDGRTDETESSAENYLANTSLFTEQRNRSASRGTGTRFKSILMGMTRGMNLMFIGTVENTHRDKTSQNIMATFDSNPYDYSSRPLDTDNEELASVSTNRMQQQSLQRSHGKSASGGLCLNKMGVRNFLINLNASYAEREQSNLTQNSTRFFRIDSVADRHRYVCTPDKRLDLSAELRYGWHFAGHDDITLNYTVNYLNDKQERSTYDLNSLSAGMEWGVLPPGYASALIDSVSRRADVHSIGHSFAVNYTGKPWSGWQVLLNVVLQPKHLHAVTVTPRKCLADEKYDFLNWKTEVCFEYRSGMAYYAFSYNGERKEPSVNYLLPVTDDDNPLWLSSGNPNLKSPVTHNLNVSFRKGYAWNALVAFRMTDNSLATQTVYDEQTGMRSCQPVNIDGSWNASAKLNYKSSWKDFTLLCNAGYNASNEARFVQNVSSGATEEKGDVRRQTASMETALRYMPKNTEIGFTVRCDLANVHNGLSDTELFTKDYAVSGEFRAFMFAGMEVNTSFACRWRRGYNFASANMNECIWNAGIRYKFLKEKTASIRLEGFDLLKQKKNISYTSSAIENSETRIRCISRYVLFTFSYRFNAFK